MQALLEASPRVPLSNIKRIFRSEFQTELSETALGYPKLSELFQDPRLEGICTTSLTKLGHEIVAPSPPAACRRRSPRVAPLSMELIDIGVSAAFMPTPSPNKVGVASVPLPTLLRALHAAPSAGGNPAPPLVEKATLPEDFELRLSVRNTFIHFALPPPTPVALPSRGRARSLPRVG